MSAEKISIASDNDIPTLVAPEVAKKELPGRVDINDLLARVREEKRKEETLERRKEKIIEIIVCDNAALVSSVFDKKIPLDNAR